MGDDFASSVGAEQQPTSSSGSHGSTTAASTTGSGGGGTGIGMTSGGGASVVAVVQPTSGTQQQQQQQTVSTGAAYAGGQVAQFDTAQDDDEDERVIETSPNGRYAKLNCVLGKGAYKVVYKAVDRDEGYEVAWNCFQTTRAEFNALSQEIDILKRVRHPNIINFHDCWYNNVEFVFVTELMTSGTLREYIRKLQIPNTKIVKRWSRQILKGLLYLHSHNPPIIHRDIKCDNIFINGAHGEVKIGDMGTAKMKMGKKYTVIGTPEFMAPEMYEEKGYSEKVDVYAFGMCLLEMVTGEYPYAECKNAAQIYKKVSQAIKPDCLAKVSDAEVVDLINCCICPENERLTVTQVLEHPFLAVEPEVTVIQLNDAKTQISFQVVFKGTDKLSVKFEFNTQTDTAEEIEENVLPQRYQTLITHEINRILRDINKISAENKDQNKEEDKLMWRRTNADVMKHELESAKRELQAATERALEAEKKAELSEARAMLAETKSKSQMGMSSPSLDGMLPSDVKLPELRQEEVVVTMKEYDDRQPIEDLVNDTASSTNRGPDKAQEWLTRLTAQDIMTVGDLRDLHDEDWASLGLTVFASRALRNALQGKVIRNCPKAGARPSISTPPRHSITASTSLPGSMMDSQLATLSINSSDASTVQTDPAISVSSSSRPPIPSFPIQPPAESASAPRS